MYTLHIPHYTKKERRCAPILAVVFGIISCSADAPEIAFHGLLTSRLILLGEEVSLVGRHVHEVFRTGCDSSVLLIE